MYIDLNAEDLFFKNGTVSYFCIGSLSKPVSSENEARVMVGKVERLAENLGTYLMDRSRPDYYGPMSWYTPKFRIPGNGLSRPSGLDNEDTSEIPTHGNELLLPWGLGNDEFTSSPTNKWLYKLFGKLLEPHFGSFPRGPYTCKYV
jgi:hypothetical protein